MEKDEKVISGIKDYIKLANKKGNESRIISTGQSLVKRDIELQSAYIKMLCESDYPITAAMTLNSMHHQDIDALKEVVLKSIEGPNWSLYDKIISLLYISNEDKLLVLLSSSEDLKNITSNILQCAEYLISQSEYELVFKLLYAAASSKNSSIISNSMYKIKINEFYVQKCGSIIQKIALTLYEKKDYDSLFMFCKNLSLLPYLKVILQKDAGKLEEEFISSQTIDGIRLAFRILEQEFKDDEKAYTEMIFKISKLNQSEDIKYIRFCYLLKLIKLQNRISDEVKEQLLSIGEVTLLNRKIYGINLLAECLEAVLVNQGMEAYNELIETLGVNYIFKCEKSVPFILPYSIYKSQALETTLIRKEYLRQLKAKEEWNEKGLFRFYMNSFYRYLISIHDFLEAIYGAGEDRVHLKNLCREYVFYGKIKSVNLERGTASAIFENTAFKHNILLSKREVGEKHISLLQKGDEFSFKLNKFTPGSGYITISNFKLLNDDRQKEFDNVDLLSWEEFKECLNEVISKQTFSKLCRERLQEVPHIEIKKLGLMEEYVALYSKVLFSLRYKADEIIDFIKTLEEHRNNLFNPHIRDQYLSFNRTEELVNRAYETTKCIEEGIDEKALIWIYVNSYLRLVVIVQEILQAMLKPGEETLQLDLRFYEYRFYGLLSTIFVNEGVKSGYVSTKSIRSIRSMSFLLDKECGVTEKMIEDKNYVSFRLRKYFKSSNRVVIEDVRNHGPSNQIKVYNWNVIHNCNKLIRYQGKVLRETLEELRRLPKLNFIKVEERKFFSDFFWCLSNLSKNENDLFLYIKALGENNPYYYVPGEYNSSYYEYEQRYNADKGEVILQKLVQNNYSLPQILWIYLNSYMCNQIPIHNVFERYYENTEHQRSRKLHYMPGRVQELEFLASVSYTRENLVFFYLKQVHCKCRVCARLEESDYTKEDFKEGQEVMIRLCEYNEDEKTIYVEIG